MGRVIGKGGETIKGLQAQSGAHITIDQNYPEGEPRKIAVSGPKGCVEVAMRMIADLLQGGPVSAGGRASLFAHTVQLYTAVPVPQYILPQYTIAASSSLAWPLVVSPPAHTVPLYPRPSSLIFHFAPVKHTHKFRTVPPRHWACTSNGLTT